MKKHSCHFFFIDNIYTPLLYIFFFGAKFYNNLQIIIIIKLAKKYYNLRYTILKKISNYQYNILKRGSMSVWHYVIGNCTICIDMFHLSIS